MKRTAEQLAEKLPSGKQTVFASRVAWATWYLSKALALDRPKKGVFRIKRRGREYWRCSNPTDGEAPVSVSRTRRLPQGRWPMSRRLTGLSKRTSWAWTSSRSKLSAGRMSSVAPWCRHLPAAWRDFEQEREC
ncbi:MAG: winged helix-turn-helix domain-containing protein [Bryobacterales bacterium]|nr:winged helix-turn-helix domain-containing protein [Bryobacterales bacterium]